MDRINRLVFVGACFLRPWLLAVIGRQETDAEMFPVPLSRRGRILRSEKQTSNASYMLHAEFWLTKKAEPSLTRDANRDSGTESASGRWSPATRQAVWSFVNCLTFDWIRMYLNRLPGYVRTQAFCKPCRFSASIAKHHPPRCLVRNHSDLNGGHLTWFQADAGKVWGI